MNEKLRASCVHDLSFPYHHDVGALERLMSIRTFMEENGYEAELLCEGPAIAKLEGKLAALFGKPAAMWCATGTLAQGIAARIYADKNGRNELLLHPTSHLLLHENDGYRVAHGLEGRVAGVWRASLTAELLEPDVACAFVEFPQRHSGGRLPDERGLAALKQKAALLGVPLHMDGARIWSCRRFYNNLSFAEIADGFSSIYVSLYKDIGAIGGAVLIGDEEFIADARLWRTRLGGLTAAPWPMVCDALRLLDKRLAQMPGFVSRAREIASALAPLESLQVDPEPPHVNMFHALLPCGRIAAERARDHAAKETGIWLGERFWNYESEDKCALEIIVGEKASAMTNQQFLDAFSVMMSVI